MGSTSTIYEKQLLENLKNGDKSAFSIVFSTYYRDLIAFANTFTHLAHISEEIVQDIFVKFWDEAQSNNINTSLKSYLLRSVQNRCIDWLRHMKTREKYSTNVLENAVLYENDTENYIFLSEIEDKLYRAISNLPEDLATALKMNKLEGYKQSEVAEKLEISVRTVEFRIAKALTLLREQLKDHFITIIVFLFSLLNN